MVYRYSIIEHTALCVIFQKAYVVESHRVQSVQLWSICIPYFILWIYPLKSIVFINYIHHSHKD